jgi:hypothetical protein
VNWTELILPIVLAIIAASPGIVALFKGRSKEKADVAKAITEAAGELVEDLQNKIDRAERKCQEDIARLQQALDEQAQQISCQELKIKKQTRQIEIQADRIREQEAEISGQADRIQVLEEERKGSLALCTQIRELGHEPVWEPESPEGQ